HVIAPDRERTCRYPESSTSRAPASRLNDNFEVVGDVRARPIVRDHTGGRRALRERGLVTDHAIVAEREYPERHDLFREMRVRPLVWLSLREELERRARVIDLVEVHLPRPIEAIAARDQDGERDEERDGEVPSRGKPPRSESGGQRPRGTGGEWHAHSPGRVRLEACVRAHEPPDEIRCRTDHQQRDRDLPSAREERRFDERGNAEIDVLLIAGEREVEREREGDGEDRIRNERTGARRREGQR